MSFIAKVIGHRRLVVGVCVVAGLAGASRSEGATITWSAAQNIMGDTDVSTNGTLVAAFNVGAPGVAATTINGVLFTPLALTGLTTTSGNFTFASADPFSNTNAAGFPAAPFSTLSATYQTLLGSSAGTPAFTLTMSGLTPGQNYEFEWWANFSALAGPLLATSTAGNSVTLRPNTGGGQGGVGQFAIGTFTADAPTQVIAFSANTTLPVFNGFELRSTSVAAAPVPEPASLSLLVLGLAGLGGRRWRQRRAARPEQAASLVGNDTPTRQPPAAPFASRAPS